MSNILTKQIHYLRILSTVPGSSLEVMLAPKSPWLPLYEVLSDMPHKPIHSRTILKNEVVLEIDSDDWVEVRDGTRRILHVLDQWGARGSYYLSFSGNRSIHVHVFFDRSLAIYPETAEVLKGRDDVLAVVKHYLLDQIAGVSRTTPDMQLAGRHLIRMEGGFNEKSRKYCTLIREVPDEKPRYYDILIPSALPPRLWNLARFERELNAFLRIHFTPKFPPVVMHGTGRPFDPEPLKDILKPVFIPGYRHFMVLAISGWLKRHGIPEYKALEVVRALNPHDQTPAKTAGTVHGVYRSGPESKVAGLPYLLNIIGGLALSGQIPANTARDVANALKALNRGTSEVPP